MTIGMAKKEVLNNKGKKCSFIFRGSRNQVEEFSGVITEIYPAIFIIKLEEGRVKSFSYSDILINNLKIIN